MDSFIEDILGDTIRAWILSLLLLLVLLGCLIGMIVDRYILLKFFLCYELFFFTLSVIMLIYSIDINVLIIVFYLLGNSTFELILGLSILILYNWYKYWISC